MSLADNLDTRCHKSSLIGQAVQGRYHVESLICKGTFGDLYKVVDIESFSLVGKRIRRAMKVIDVRAKPRISPRNYTNHQLAQARREIDYHLLVSSHPNIVTLHEWFHDSSREEMVLILDYCAGGDLQTYITKDSGNPFAEDDRQMKQIILQICDAVDFIHSKGVFHKDIKPQNILISPDGWKVFLCDFGLATDMRTDCRGEGTKSYMSPELLQEQGFYCPQRADVWALGVTILDMLGICLWNSATIHSIGFLKFMLVDDYLVCALSRSISAKANDLIRDILRFHPELRLSIPEISARVLQLPSFFEHQRASFSAAELQELASLYQCTLTRIDPIARRRRELEDFRRMVKNLAFNDLTGRTPYPPICTPGDPHSNSSQHHYGVPRLHCGPISGFPAQVEILSEQRAAVLKHWRNVFGMSVAGYKQYYF
ncbi:kinase-like domain-containing protein [Thelephora terrestris]|uniref:Kinase-like domain-containing protein n=1 Tax=Thelephora terrestris TaxID=56493 RepID=A0A9P6HGI8_9AGAM|nr:kinase-like domain-containing protein [Thelephora terrestris]